MVALLWPSTLLPSPPFHPPSDKPALQRFLGMLNFYRKFLRDAAQVLAPLTDPLKGPGKSLIWSPVLDYAFTRAK